MYILVCRLIGTAARFARRSPTSDLEAEILPCPKRGERFRTALVERGGEAQFPYLIDPNTGEEMYESNDIIQYLFRHYGDGSPPWWLSLGPLTDVSGRRPSAARFATPSIARTGSATLESSRATITGFKAAILSHWQDTAEESTRKNRRHEGRVMTQQQSLMREALSGARALILPLTKGLALIAGTLAGTLTGAAGAAELQIGKPAPDFALIGSDGKSHSLAEHKGVRGVVLAWFPKAFTPG